MDSSLKPLKVGVVGCGVVSQTTHFPTLKLMSDYFTIAHICDLSKQALAHCSVKYSIPRTTNSYEELVSDAEVKAIFVLTTDEFHRDIAVAALEHGKHVFIEKCVTVCPRGCSEIIEAERKSKGRVMVGYMRRYAAGLLDALKEVGGMQKIIHAKVRDIIGPNPYFM